MKRGPEEVRRSRAEALQSAERASLRAATVVHGEMKRGLGSLATIGSTAPWIGVLGTVRGIHDTFLGVNGSKESIMAAIFERLSQALVPAALGLFVALAALLCYKYLLAEVEAFDSEMESASLQLVNHLGRLRTN
jgi:biopolymer transport protein ExbB/TolQ